MRDDNYFHRQSLRLRGYDYSQPGKYFVTIVTKDRECLFGNVINDNMVLNDAGKSVKGFWLSIPEHYPKVVLDAYIIMPNHVHGIIVIKDKKFNNTVPVIPVGVPVIPVGVQNLEPLRDDIIIPKINQYQKIIPRSLGSIIRGFKIGVTKWFREYTEIHDVWQRNFYDHIVQTEKELWRIRAYIKNNPVHWDNDISY